MNNCAQAKARGLCDNVEDLGYDIRNKHCCATCGTCGRRESMQTRYRNGPPELATSEGRVLLQRQGDEALADELRGKACAGSCEAEESVARRGFVVLRAFVPEAEVDKLASYASSLPYPERWLCGASELLPTMAEERQSDRTCRFQPERIRRDYPGLVAATEALFRSWFAAGYAQRMPAQLLFESRRTPTNLSSKHKSSEKTLGHFEISAKSGRRF